MHFEAFMFDDQLSGAEGAAITDGAHGQAEVFGGDGSLHQQSVTSRLRATASAKNESRRGVHEKMVPMHWRENRGAPRRKKKGYICCLGFAMLAASPIFAAEGATSSLLTPPADSGKVSVVRVDRRTGKLVRTVAGGETKLRTVTIALPPAHIQQLVEQSARAHHVDPLLVQSVIQVERNYNHYAVSPKGAEGLMQL